MATSTPIASTAALLVLLLVGPGCSAPPQDREDHVVERTLPGLTIDVFPVCKRVLEDAPEVTIASDGDEIFPFYLLLDWTGAAGGMFVTRSVLRVAPAEDPRWSTVCIRTNLYIPDRHFSFMPGAAMGARLSGDLKSHPHLPEELLDRIEERLNDDE